MATTTDQARHDASPGPQAVNLTVDSNGPDPVDYAVVPVVPTALPYPRSVTASREFLTLTATHCTIVVGDVVGFGDYRRNNINQVRVRRGLYGAMRFAFDASGIPWEDCRREDRGDGIFILAPAAVPKALFVDRLPDALADALVAHNKAHPPEEQIRLRLALHAGEIYQDEHGVTSSSINHTFRILDAGTVAATLANSSGVLAVIGSAWFYEEVIRNSDWSRANSYTAVDVANKETVGRAWVRVVKDGRPRRHLATRAISLRKRPRPAT